MYRENRRKMEKVRYFWRNKIYEGNSRGAELLKSALIYSDMFSYCVITSKIKLDQTLDSTVKL